VDHWGFGVWVLPLALSAALCLAAAERLAPPSASPKHAPGCRLRGHLHT